MIGTLVDISTDIKWQEQELWAGNDKDSWYFYWYKVSLTGTLDTIIDL